MWDDISWPFLWEWFEAALFINYFLFLVKHNKRSFRVQKSVGKVRIFLQKTIIKSLRGSNTAYKSKPQKYCILVIR